MLLSLISHLLHCWILHVRGCSGPNMTARVCCRMLNCVLEDAQISKACGLHTCLLRFIRLSLDLPVWLGPIHIGRGNLMQ